MKPTVIALLFLLSFSTLFSLKIKAQSKQGTIVEVLETFVLGQGYVKIDCDPKIIALIGKLSPETGTSEVIKIKTNGYRVQVFMSNNPKTALTERDEKRKLINKAFPDTDLYTEYTAPNFKLLAGDFMTKEEAEIFRRKLLKTIPSLGKEMYIVDMKVDIPLLRNN